LTTRFATDFFFDFLAIELHPVRLTPA
jgi:hypothetical protein